MWEQCSHLKLDLGECFDSRKNLLFQNVVVLGFSGNNMLLFFYIYIYNVIMYYLHVLCS